MLGYVSVAAEAEERCRAEFRRQADSIASECRRRELSLAMFVREREPRHQRALERPALGYALGRIAAGEASGLVVSDLSRLAHSVPELGRLLEWLSSHDARLVAANPGLDTDEEVGRSSAVNAHRGCPLGAPAANRADPQRDACRPPHRTGQRGAVP